MPPSSLLRRCRSRPCARPRYPQRSGRSRRAPPSCRCSAPTGGRDPFATAAVRGAGLRPAPPPSSPSFLLATPRAQAGRAALAAQRTGERAQARGPAGEREGAMVREADPLSNPSPTQDIVPPAATSGEDRTRRPAQPAPLPSSTRPFAGRGREHMQSYQLAVVTELLKAFSRPPSHRPSTSPGSAGHFLCPVPFGRLHTFAAYEVGNRTPFPVAWSIDLRPIHRRLSDRVMRLGRLRPQSLPNASWYGAT